MKKRAAKGSMTVEMSLLMPFILAVIIFIIYMGFYLHDRCLITKMYATAGLRASLVSSKDEIENTVVDCLNNQENYRLTGIWETYPEVNVYGNEIYIREVGNMRVTGGLLSLIFSKRDIKYDFINKAYFIDEIKYVREIRRKTHSD